MHPNPAIRKLARTVVAGAAAISLTGTLAAPAMAEPSSASGKESSDLVTIRPGDTIVDSSGNECTMTKQFYRPSAAKKGPYAEYGVNGWGVLKGNCGSLNGFWVRTGADEVRGILEKTPAAELADKVLPPQTKTMKEIGKPAYLKGKKDEGVVGWMITTGVGISFIGVNRTNAQYEGPSQVD